MKKYIPITDDVVLKLSKIAKKHNIQLYAVGGFVRDYYLNRERKDIDCTVVGDALEFAEIVAKEFKSKAIIFERFRTAMVPVGDYQLEFVGTRKEIYEENSRKPIVTEGTLEDDLRRRDFTVNALAVSLNKDNIGELIDLFDGMSALNDKILKTPLDPTITFSEDPLRMMRAARFAAQLNFELDPATFESIKPIADRIKIISQERISDELLKIISSNKPSVGFKILYSTGLLKLIFPELYQMAGIDTVTKDEKVFSHKDVFYHSLTVLDNICLMTDKLWLRFAALVHDIAKPRTKNFSETSGWTFWGHEELGARMMEKIFRKLKLPLEPLPYVQKLIRLHQRPMQLVDEGVTDSAVRRLAVNAGEALEDLFTLCKADITTKNPNLSHQYYNNYENVLQKVIEVQEKDKLREFQSPVRGEEIMEICGLTPSKAVGVIKSNIEEAILDGIIPNTYEDAKNYLLANKEQWLIEVKPQMQNFRRKK